MKYLLKRNGKVVQQIVMVGEEKNNFKTPEVFDLEFETYEAAQEVATVLDAEIIDMNTAKVA
jgi:hypothetical protein